MATKTAPRLFQAREVARLLDVPVRRVESWTELGFIKPHARGRGKGSRHGFDLANVVEGVMLLAIQSVMGEHSPAPWAMLVLVNEHAQRFAESLLQGWTPVGERLVILHPRSGPAIATLKRDFGPEEETGEQLAKLLKKYHAVTFIDLTDPLTALAQGIKEGE
jgi:hypothetical protein